MTVFRYIQNVLWSFAGLGRRADFDEVMGKGNPLCLIGVALVLVALFVAGLVLLARVAVGTLGTT